MVTDHTAPAIPDDDKDITLRDVLIHMQHGFMRLEGKIDGNTKAIKENAKRIDGNSEAIAHLNAKLTARIDSVEQHLTARIDALDEDLTATIKDTLSIRRHVGMRVGDQ